MSEQLTATSAPALDVFVIDTSAGREDEGQGSWIRIGSAFPHRDGKGFNVELKAAPIGGRLVVREHPTLHYLKVRSE
jgi:hypothetical protein